MFKNGIVFLCIVALMVVAGVSASHTPDRLPIATESYDFTQGATTAGVLRQLARLTERLVQIQAFIAANPSLATPANVESLRQIAISLRELYSQIIVSVPNAGNGGGGGGAAGDNDAGGSGGGEAGDDAGGGADAGDGSAGGGGGSTGGGSSTGTGGAVSVNGGQATNNNPGSCTASGASPGSARAAYRNQCGSGDIFCLQTTNPVVCRAATRYNTRTAIQAPPGGVNNPSNCSQGSTNGSAALMSYIVNCGSDHSYPNCAPNASGNWTCTPTGRGVVSDMTGCYAYGYTMDAAKSLYRSRCSSAAPSCGMNWKGVYKCVDRDKAFIMLEYVIE